MARRLGISISSGLTVLRKGSWVYPYRGEQEWQTDVPEDPNYQYGTSEPTIDESGIHIFANSGALNTVSVANSGIGIDLTNYSRIRIKYAKWINCDRFFMSAIELQPVGSQVYLPYANAGSLKSQLRDDLIITHPDDQGPGEIVFEIPNEAKTVDPIRKLWVKAIKNYYYGNAYIAIESITFEK